MMNRTIRTTALVLGLALALGAPATAASLQEGTEPQEQDFEDFAPQQDAQQEMVELFRRVEKRLRAIDAMLVEASTGDVSKLEEAGSSGIDELLRDLPEAPQSSGGSGGGSGLSGALNQSQGQGEQLMREIDEIIRIAESMPSSQGQGQQPQQQSEGSSPLDRPSSRREKSQSPEDPKEQGEGEKPEQQGDDPNNPNESQEDGRNEKGSKAPSNPLGSPTRPVDERDHWGDLPVHVRDIFRAEGGPGLPVQYRDWIDSYYRRLNERSSD